MCHWAGRRRNRAALLCSKAPPTPRLRQPQAPCERVSVTKMWEEQKMSPLGVRAAAGGCWPLPEAAGPFQKLPACHSDSLPTGGSQQPVPCGTRWEVLASLVAPQPVSPTGTCRAGASPGVPGCAMSGSGGFGAG